MGSQRTFWFVLAGLLFQAVFVSAQNIDSLTGVVLDIRSNQPIKGAKVHLEQRAGFSAVTDDLGHFKLKFDPPLRINEPAKIIVEKSGFKTLIQSIQISEVALTLELTPVEGPNYRKWISLGVSTAAAGTALAFLQAANNSRDEAEASRTESEFNQFNDDFRRNKTLAITFEIIAGAAGGYFLYEQFFKPKPSSEVIAKENNTNFQITPQLTREGAMIVVHKKF